MKSRLALLANLILIAALLGGCAPYAPGASLVDRLFGKAEVQFLPKVSTEMRPGHSIEVTFSDGQEQRSFEWKDFAGAQSGEGTGPFQTARRGDLEISSSLRGPSGEVLAEVKASLPLRPDWQYGIWIVIGSDDPVAGCFGCMGSASAPLDPSLGYPAGTGLSIVWGGNWISHPVVY